MNKRRVMTYACAFGGTKSHNPLRYILHALTALVLLLVLWLGNPALALIAAAFLSLIFNQPPLPDASRYGRLALQTAVVLLGLGMDARHMLVLSQDYALAISVYVIITLGFGLLLGWLLRSPDTSSKLVASGTAICGGTAVATLSPLLRASTSQTGVVLTLVFLLNAVALLIMPWIGHYLAMSQTAFGLWVAMAVHDTSSVVATAAIYGEEAAATATTLKLGRTLWLIPLALFFSMTHTSSNTRVRVPVFILLFILASVMGTWFDFSAATGSLVTNSSKVLLVLALFCIGGEISRETLRHLRGREVLQGLLLWLFVLPLTLVAAFWLT